MKDYLSSIFQHPPPSSMAVAKIDSLLQGMLTLEPSGKRYFERTSALSEVSEMKAPNDYVLPVFRSTELSFSFSVPSKHDLNTCVHILSM